MNRAVGALLLLAACDKLDQNEFIAEFEVLYCEGYSLCASEEMLRAVNERECLQYVRYQEYPVDSVECRYDAEKAQACIDGLHQSGCVGVNPEVPQSCEDVWSKCVYAVLPPTLTDGTTAPQ